MRRGLIASLCAALAAGAAHAGCLDDTRLVGVNLAGAEFNAKRLPGVRDKDYTYPHPDDLAYFAARGATAIRLPFRWERAQPRLMDTLDPAETAAIAKVVDAAARHDLCVILDAHNYATWRGTPIGSPEVPEAAFVDFWRRMARRFSDPHRVVLGLMNEPSKISVDAWAGLARQTVRALREAGAQHLILVAGGRWSGVHDWHKGSAGQSNAEAFAGFSDPLGRMALEVHQFVDDDFSGTTTACRPPARFDNMFHQLGVWARMEGQRLFLGEVGVPAREECLATLERILELTSDRGQWLGFTYWAAGRWWKNYPLDISPANGADAPQMDVLGRYLQP